MVDELVVSGTREWDSVNRGSCREGSLSVDGIAISNSAAEDSVVEIFCRRLTVDGCAERLTDSSRAEAVLWSSL